MLLAERKRREQRRSRRRERDVPVISLVGYTNAGKSTLLNLLTRSEVFVEHRMFATLDPTSSSGGSSGATKKPRPEPQKKKKGAPVTNPSINTETSKKFMKDYNNNRKKLEKALPRYYQDGEKSSQRCINFDIRGKCQADCPRSHATASTACYAALWETAKGVVGE